MRRAPLTLFVALALTACGGDAERTSFDAAANERNPGEMLAFACMACHTLQQGGDHQIGPNLSGVFGRPAASVADFDYSDALRNSGIVWTPEVLDRWLADPGGFLPGTTMAFSGYRQPQDRQALIDFLLQATTR